MFAGLAHRVVGHIDLAKLSLSFVMTASALTAYVVQRPHLELAVVAPILCVLLLCLGSATLNNYQDREIDTRLQRTRERPLPLGEIGSRSALLQAGLLLLSGTLGLFLVAETPALPLTGLVAVCFYNGIYTPLKKRTTLAVIPGAMSGSLPVLMGWMAAGGGLASPKLWILLALFGVWQLPHFWLVVLANRRDYSDSGIPTMLRFFSAHQLRQLVFIWVAAFVVLTLCLPLYRVTLSEPAGWVLLANALLLASVTGLLLGIQGGGDRYRKLFTCLNLSLAVVMTVVVADGFVLS
jgi:protoheme IX farnesyltransferase